MLLFRTLSVCVCGIRFSRRVLCGVFASVMACVSFVSKAEYHLTVDDAAGALAARDAIRQARAGGKIAKDEEVTVTFSPGTYVFDKTLALEDKDSGTEVGPVKWRVEKRGTVRIFGGSKIPPSSFVRVEDKSAAMRIPESARDKVLVCDVSGLLVKDVGAWADKISGVLTGPWLHVNGVSQTIARWPNADAAENGWFGYTNLVEKGSKSTPGAFVFPGDRAKRWDLSTGVWLMGYWRYDWHSEVLKLGSYDANTHVARLAGPSTYGLGNGKSWPFNVRRFYALNLLEELDAPGEWYLDRVEKKLYWYPQGLKADGTDEIVLAQALTPFVTVTDARHICFENLSFEYSHGKAAVKFSKTERCSVMNCDFANHSGTPVFVEGFGNRVVGSSFRNVGGTAIYISGGDVANLLPANNTVYRCVVENYAMYQRTMAPGIWVAGCGNAVRNCLVRNAPYIGLWYYGNEHLIADNEFDHVVQEAGDSGCIYSGNNPSFLGTIVFGNYIHDLAKTPAEADSRNGIYFDDCDWGDDVIGNTFVHAGRAIFFGGGKLHGAYNNLIKDSYVGVHCDARGRVWRRSKTHNAGSFGWDKKGRSYAHVRIAEAGGNRYCAPWSVVYPTLEEAVDNRPELPGMNDVKGNVIQRCKMPCYYDKSSKEALGDGFSGNNTVLADTDEAPARAVLPIRLMDAVKNRFESADGTTVMKVALDESARLSWSLDVNGRHLIQRSPLGLTVDDFDFGRRIVPGKAEETTGGIASGEFAVATCQESNAPQGYVRNMTATNFVPASAVRGWKVPLKCLVTGKEVAALEVAVWKGGAAFRWRIPGAGERRVRGENTCFIGDRKSFTVYEWNRPADWPEFITYPRGAANGICFPECPRGWKQEGAVTSPWRGVVVGKR